MFIIPWQKKNKKNIKILLNSCILVETIYEYINQKQSELKTGDKGAIRFTTNILWMNKKPLWKVTIAVYVV